MHSLGSRMEVCHVEMLCIEQTNSRSTTANLEKVASPAALQGRIGIRSSIKADAFHGL